MKQLLWLILVTGFAVLCVPAQTPRPEPARTTAPENGAASAASATPLKILTKPGAVYTNAAKDKRTEGFVRLKVTFLSNGEIGAIAIVAGLPNGLNEKAIEAAKQIKFEPAKRNGVAVSVTKTIEYVFVLFVLPEEGLPKDAKKVVLLEKPEPDYPAGEDFKNMRGFVRVKILFTSFGEPSPVVESSNLPRAFEIKALEAAQKIKYEPASSPGWGNLSVIKTIEYEFTPKN